MTGTPFISLPIYTAATTASSPPPPPPLPPQPTIPSPSTTTATPTPKHSTGPTCFRLLCHASRIGGIIGKSGSIIKQLQHSTSSKIRIQDSPPGCEYRVITIFADSTVNKTMSFTNQETKISNLDNVNDGEEESLYSEVSAAQEALVRVCERIFCVAAETEGDYYYAADGVVSCRLLTDRFYVKFVIGRGGKRVSKITKDTGCRIRFSGQDNFSLPSCAMPNDEVVVIEGDILAVRKALIAVARILQDSPPSDKDWLLYGRSCNGFSREPPFPNGFNQERTFPNGFNQERTFPNGFNKERAFPNGFNQERAFPNGFNQESTFPNGFSQEHTLSNGFDQEHQFPNGFNQEHTLTNGYMNAETFPSADSRSFHGQRQIVFRILCSEDRIAQVIGPSGTIIRSLESESGAHISVAPSVYGCDQRLITITSIESPESPISPAQNAVILVFNRSVYENGSDSPSSGNSIFARLVIQPKQMGCLIGKQGSIMSDMRKVTGAFIKIVGGHKVPRCAPETDQVVLIKGGCVNVRDALYSVTSRLRNLFFSSRISSGLNTNGQPSFGVDPPMATRYDNQQTSLAESMHNLRVSNNVDQPSSSGSQDYQGGDGNQMNHFKGGVELGRGSTSAIITSTTVEIMVPRNIIRSVFGENGSNLARLRQISCAKVVVHETGSGLQDHIVVISGTPDQTQSAQSLLHAFILTDQQ
ncbi:KH domain-containing protein HEN4-like [Rutidosis leptorrhynchoides]|uniref:KH domain-containing protein HEN4-like n=1 Tax=Rutidosis leptorrhynchoides TaxID=125765 RepID=UPI003A9904E2